MTTTTLWEVLYDKVDQHLTDYPVARKRAGGVKNNTNYRVAIAEQNKPNVQLSGPGRPSNSCAKRLKTCVYKDVDEAVLNDEKIEYIPKTFFSLVFLAVFLSFLLAFMNLKIVLCGL
ncbi:UNVERIFIED_CONTAM: hypothetical protein NCL1_16760 [Trichonephila clavipes]